MCQDCDRYDLDDSYDDDDVADDWGDDGYPDPDHDDYPDGDDYELAQSYYELAEHCERKHGGGECHCKPSLLARLRWWLADARRDWRFSSVRRWIDVRLNPDRYDDMPPF